MGKRSGAGARGRAGAGRPARTQGKGRSRASGEASRRAAAPTGSAPGRAGSSPGSRAARSAAGAPGRPPRSPGVSSPPLPSIYAPRASGRQEPDESDVRTVPRAAAAIPFEVAVCESSRAEQNRVRAMVDQLGYRVAPEQDTAAITARLRSNPPRAIVAALPEQSGLVAACVDLPERPVVIAALSGPGPAARARAVEAGADLFALRPHDRDGLAAALQAAEKIAALRDRVTALRGSEEMLRERLQRHGQSDLATGFFHIEFFEQVLLMELKRAKRYGYMLAACLVALDAWRDPEPPPAAVGRRLRSLVATTIAGIVRDIDMPVDLTEDRMLIFLPFTDLQGATQVGRRISAAVTSKGTLADGVGRSWRPAVSIGIAALRPGKPISFARLMRDATSALRAAQLKGGDRVVVRT